MGKGRGMSEDKDTNPKTIADNYQEEVELRASSYREQLMRIMSEEGGVLQILLSDAGKNLEALSHIPRLLTNSLTDGFRLGKEKLLLQFQDDVKMLIKSGELKELEDREIASLMQAAGDLLDAQLALIIGMVSESLSNYLKWVPQIEGGESIERAKKFIEELINVTARAMAERDVLKKFLKDIKSQVREKYIRNSTAFKILAILEDEGLPMKPTEIASRMGLSEVTIRRHLKRLIEDGYVEVDTTTRPYRYSLVRTPWESEAKEETR